MLSTTQWRVRVVGRDVDHIFPARNAKHASDLFTAQAVKHPGAIISLEKTYTGGRHNWEAVKIRTPEETGP